MRGDEDPRFEKDPVPVAEGGVAVLWEAAVRTAGRCGWWRGGCAFEGGLECAVGAVRTVCGVLGVPHASQGPDGPSGPVGRDPAVPGEAGAAGAPAGVPRGLWRPRVHSYVGRDMRVCDMPHVPLRSLRAYPCGQGLLPPSGALPSGDGTSGFLKLSHLARPACGPSEGEEARAGGTGSRRRPSQASGVGRPPATWPGGDDGVCPAAVDLVRGPTADRRTEVTGLVLGDTGPAQMT
ncbi:hypothetical protein ACVWZD_008950 [Streptomyces sp. TE3672]